MISDILIYLFLAIGLTFNALGVIGLLRFPDVYTRLHASTKNTTFGTIFTSFAIVVYAVSRYLWTSDGQYLTLIVRGILIVVFVLLTMPTGAHAIARAAHRMGILPRYAVVDRLEEVGR